jgi:hypothetical protein
MANLIPDPGFEAGITEWSASFSDPVLSWDTEARSGAHSMRIARDSGENIYYYVEHLLEGLVVDEVYYVEAWVRSAGPGYCYSYFDSGAWIEQSGTPVDASWKRIWTTFTAVMTEQTLYLVSYIDEPTGALVVDDAFADLAPVVLSVTGRGSVYLYGTEDMGLDDGTLRFDRPAVVEYGQLGYDEWDISVESGGPVEMAGTIDIPSEITGTMGAMWVGAIDIPSEIIGEPTITYPPDWMFGTIDIPSELIGDFGLGGGPVEMTGTMEIPSEIVGGFVYPGITLPPVPPPPPPEEEGTFPMPVASGLYLRAVMGKTVEMQEYTVVQGAPTA